MRRVMLAQIAVGVEFLAARGAFERAHLIVDPHVDFKSRFLVESFGAHRTGEIVEIAIVLVVDVGSQQIPRSERTTAMLAQIRLLSFVIGLVDTNPRR